MQTITFSQLGLLGRFGNQFFQYVFLRLMADKWGWQYACPAWEGQKLFSLADPPVSQPGQLIEDYSTQLSESIIANFQIPRGTTSFTVDIAGYFQFHTSYYRPHREKIQQWFTIKFPPALPFASMDIIAIHLRRGDYCHSTSGYAFVPPNEWYLRWLEGIWNTWEKPVLYIATDDVTAAQDFRKYDPITTSDFEWDFYAMTQARALAISNSTFSFAAAMLNTRASGFFRPVIDRYPVGGALQSFDPWDADPLLHRDRPEAI